LTRNFGILQRDEMGLVTQCRYDQFGNKAVEIDSAGARKEWYTTTAEYVVGRIETYRLPADTGSKFGSYTYNDLSELTVDAVGNSRTEYDRHQNGLVFRATIRPDTTAPNVREMTTYFYDARGQLTSESRIDSDSIQTKHFSYDNQGRLARVEDQNKAPAGPISDVRYSYDEWGNIRRIQSAYTQTAAEGPRTSDSWYAYDAAGRMTISNGKMSRGEIRLKLRTPGSVQIGYDSVGRRSGTTEYVRSNNTSVPTFARTWDTVRDESHEYDDLGHLRKTEQRVRHINVLRYDLNGFAAPRNLTSFGVGGQMVAPARMRRRDDDLPNDPPEDPPEDPPDPVSEPDRAGSWQLLSIRSSNLRGDVTRAGQWSRISGTYNNLEVDQVSAHLSTTDSAYRADGQVAWTNTVAVDPTRSTMTQNVYDAQTGQLSSYEFTQYRPDLTPYIANFTYGHTLQNGNRVVSRISDAYRGLDTIKTYDGLGRLSYERVDLQRPNGSGSDRYEERL
jgi:YD repeat-containing protein